MNALLTETILPSRASLQLVQGDITTETTDAIVNAANGSLQHGAGVAGAILRRGGPVIKTESEAWVREHGLVSHAEPAWTSGGNLPAKYVIHAVGPVWSDTSGGDEDAKLAAALTGSLRVADWLGLASIAIPAISTGIFGFPKERAAGIILSTVKGFFVDRPNSGIKLVRLVLYDQETITCFLKTWNDFFSAKP